MFNFTAAPPLSLYVHFPWCVRKCPYCDFNSHNIKNGIPEKAYIDALIGDLDQELSKVWGRRVISIFMGGGTPSLFSPEAIDALLSAIRARLPLLPDAEITMEANPGTVEQQRFAEFRDAGINRLSIGVQSFDPHKLAALGRIHSRQEAVHAAEMAHKAGFNNINLDLMFGLPGQSQAQALADVQTAVDLQPTHVSYYQLTLEPNTYFYRYPPTLPADELIWSIQCQGEEHLAARGYHQYEVSAYAKDQQRCQHNMNYWLFGDYLGIGAGAHAKVTDVNAKSITRTSKVKQPNEYLAKATQNAVVLSQQQLQPEDAILEFMMNALRLTQGFAVECFTERTGLHMTHIDPVLEKAQEFGWIARNQSCIKTTASGRC
ncbi:radical SAM family heme chaperone HemW, partial [Kaarinaea lacus]